MIGEVVKVIHFPPRGTIIAKNLIREGAKEKGSIITCESVYAWSVFRSHPGYNAELLDKPITSDEGNSVALPKHAIKYAANINGIHSLYKLLFFFQQRFCAISIIEVSRQPGKEGSIS